ncbi:hypothetical protein [Marinobacter sp. ELB17]|uniref:RIFT barrel domain-containing protein n=1 Tax=Marinobacter sp. ELB17 TaxID=270374 RepID=UPI0000F3B47D|nr:hypothetical protein [Marinobacter sp. ELB17]EAZ98660.1 hypothetical protein MELB17_14281 [Marinobacter sp. ELB17]
MEKIAIQLEEVNGVARINEPVGLGIPLPKGTIQTVHNLTLLDDHKPLSLQLQPLAHWPDGSIRWVHASFLINLDSNSKKSLVLAQHQTPSPRNPESVIDQTTESLMISTATGRVTLQPSSLAWHVDNDEGAAIPSVVSLSDENGAPCTVKTEASWKITHEGSVFVAATLKGEWLKQNSEPLARFECELRIFLETGLVQVELVTHNPKRARHPGGLWDLGDPGSVYFRELAVETTLPAKSIAQVTPQAIDDAPGIYQLPDFNLYQDSSGGENWKSRNHIDCNGEVSTQFCGYRLSTPSELLHEGKRANPLISIEHDHRLLDVTAPNFWQNFPTSLRKEGSKLTVGMFPKDAKNVYELQGGEQKTLRCLMAYSPNRDCSSAATAYAPLIPVLAAECYEQAEAFPWFKADAQPDALDELIAEGLNGPSNFFAKRELIDEFGWRNFGDIFADHETLYGQEGAAPFISHYNNQYDAIYGFARQFALTGDRKWYKLMDDLAAHVVDIDIYHTDEDRVEYNNGLFWHTDHYLDAHSATHRTFSKQNETSSTPGQTGGGPAAEHCYTTGLLYHYFLTGNRNSRETVLELARWMVALHEGQGGLLEQLVAIKKYDIPLIKALLRGAPPDAHLYPFTRGTGNYINALIDAWQVSGEPTWIRRAEQVIRHSIHSGDDISKRNLLNAETGWSYLVLMTSVARFLHLKRREGQLDQEYKSTRDAFIHYTRWMKDHEHPFLETPEQLEFPNDTWTAQDIRKAMLLFQAAEFDPLNNELYLSLAREILQYVVSRLASSNEAHFSRIMIILMQNHGPHLLAESGRETLPSQPDQLPPSKAPLLSWKQLLTRIALRLMRGIATFSPSRERAWLNLRLNRS